MSFDPAVFDGQVFGAAQAESCLFDGAIFDPAVFDVCVDGEVVPEAAPAQVVGGGRRRRSFVELDGELVEVSGYEEAERLLTELKKEEKAQEKARKKLRIKLGKVEDAPLVEVRAIEQQMDDRAERIAKLYALIQQALEDDDTDDEEILFS